MPSVKSVAGNKKRRGTIFVSVLLVLAIFAILANNVSALATSPPMGAAASFGVLGHTTVTNTGSTTITGDLGDEGAGPIPGLASITLLGGGVVHQADAVAGSAQVANTAAFGALDQPCGTTYTGTQDLVGLTLGPGVYCADNFALSGTLTLTGSGVWIFKSAGTLVTSGTAKVVGGDPCNVWWRVVSSATLGTYTELEGNILASTSISLQTGAILTGKALTQTGAVTLDINQVNTFDCAIVSTVTTTITTVIGGVTTTIVTAIVLLFPVAAKPLVAPVPVGGVMLQSVGFTVLLPWAIALLMLGVLSVEAFLVKRRAKRR